MLTRAPQVIVTKADLQANTLAELVAEGVSEEVPVDPTDPTGPRRKVTRQMTMQEQQEVRFRLRKAWGLPVTDREAYEFDPVFRGYADDKGLAETIINPGGAGPRSATPPAPNQEADLTFQRSFAPPPPPLRLPPGVRSDALDTGIRRGGR
jgi:hypothetical protein